MKKIFVSAGLLAIGTAGLQAAYAPDAGADASKIWDVRATLRGFYDDNYLTLPQKHGSFGFEVSPTLDLNVPLQQTEIGLSYQYGLYYYQNRQDQSQNPIDQTHQFNLWLDHAFSPRWQARLEDSVVVAQEPALLTPGAVTVAQRTEGNNLVNTADLTVNTVWTRLFSTAFNYQNTVSDYENSGWNPVVGASLAGLLNRVDQSASLDLKWQAMQETTFLVGYQIELVNFIGNEQITENTQPPYSLANPYYYYSDSRDNLSHYGYVGVQHKFLENLTGSAKVGVEYTTYLNDSTTKDAIGPYADASLIYTYAAGSYMQLGVMETRNATDTVSVDSSGRITQDQESTVVYGSINHPLTPKLMASVVGHYQYSIYNDGLYNNQAAQFYNLGLNLAYSFNRHFSSEIGYNFDYYTSPYFEYSRNRIYLGVTASY